MFESEEDSYVTSTDYSQDYPLEGFVADTPHTPSTSIGIGDTSLLDSSLPTKYFCIDRLNNELLH